jgi:hypothetical protein
MLTRCHDLRSGAQASAPSPDWTDSSADCGSSLNKAKSLPPEFEGRLLEVGTKDGWIGSALDGDEEAVERRRMAVFRDIDGWVPEAAIIIGDHASVDLSGIVRLIPDGLPTFHYVPIEGVGLKPGHADIWRKLRPVAMSEFGADQIATIYPERPPVIYHGVDTEVFRPVSPQRPITIRTKHGLAIMRTKAECKRFLGEMFTVTDNETGKRWPLWQEGRSRCSATTPTCPGAGRRCSGRLPRSQPEPDVDLVYHTRPSTGGDLEIEKSGYPVESDGGCCPPGCTTRGRASASCWWRC